VTRYEVMSGVNNLEQTENARKLFVDVPTLVLDAEGADRAAEVHRELERKGVAIGTPDSLIAGIALSANCPLLTRNRRHFERVEGLMLVPLA
jgi:tRNA(fMet)-specific endonuclease VapC